MAEARDTKTRFVSNANVTGCEQSIHVVVLVHGLCGNVHELEYLHNSFDQHAKSSGSKLIVHSSKSNGGSLADTLDGVATGGDRLASEINELMQNVIANNHHTMKSVSFSMIGNSLGGVYARYALSKILWEVPVIISDGSDLGNKHIQIQPFIFGTTATPHLGIGPDPNCAYISLASWFMQWLVVWMLRRTGRDLVRQSSLLSTMTTDPIFTKPLRRFRHRFAYANGFGTDFQVPFSTGAFVVGNEGENANRSVPNDSMHTVVKSTFKMDDDIDLLRICDNDGVRSFSEPYIALRVSTTRKDDSFDNQPRNEGELSPTCSKDENEPLSSADKLSSSEMAQRLDDMGWTKVVIDMRRHLFSFPCWWPWRAEISVETREELAEGGEVSSIALFEAFHRNQRGTWTFPWGHSMMVANAKNLIWRWMHQGGGAVMDGLARDVIHQIELECRF